MPANALLLDDKLARCRNEQELRDRESIKIYAAALGPQRPLATVLQEFAGEATRICSSMDELVSIMLARELTHLATTIRVDSAGTSRESAKLTCILDILLAHCVKWAHPSFSDRMTLKEFMLFVGINNATRRFQNWKLAGVTESVKAQLWTLRELPVYVCDAAKVLSDRFDALFAAAAPSNDNEEEEEPLAKRRLVVCPFAANLYTMLGSLDAFVSVVPFCASNELMLVAREIKKYWSPAPFEEPDLALAISVVENSDKLFSRFKTDAERIIRKGESRLLSHCQGEFSPRRDVNVHVTRLDTLVRGDEVRFQLANKVAPVILEHFFALIDALGEVRAPLRAERDDAAQPMVRVIERELCIYERFGLDWDTENGVLDETTTVRFNPFLFVSEPNAWRFYTDQCSDLVAVEIRLCIDAWVNQSVIYEQLLPSKWFVAAALVEAKDERGLERVAERLLLNHAARIIYLLMTGKTFASSRVVFAQGPLRMERNTDEGRRLFVQSLPTTVDLHGEPLSPEFLHLLVNLYYGTVRQSAETRQFITNVFNAPRDLDQPAELQKKFNEMLNYALTAPAPPAHVHAGAGGGGGGGGDAHRRNIFGDRVEVFREGRVDEDVTEELAQHHQLSARPIVLNITGRVQVDVGVRGGGGGGGGRRNAVAALADDAEAALAAAVTAHDVQERHYHDALIAFMAQIGNYSGETYPSLQFHHETGNGLGPTLDGMQQIIDAYLAHSGARCYYDESLQCIRVRPDAYFVQLERGDKAHRHLTCKVCHGADGAGAADAANALSWIDVDYLTGGRFWAAFEARFDAVMLVRGAQRARTRPLELFSQVCAAEKKTHQEMLQHMRAVHGRGWQHCWLAEPDVAARAPASALVASDPTGVFLATLLHSVTMKRNTLHRLVDPLLLSVLFGASTRHKSIAAHYLQLGEPSLEQFSDNYINNNDDYADDNDGSVNGKTLTANFIGRHSRNVAALCLLVSENTLVRYRHALLRKVVLQTPAHSLTMLMQRLVGATYARLRTMRMAGAGGIDDDVFRAAIIGSLRVSSNIHGASVPSVNAACNKMSELERKFQAEGRRGMLAHKAHRDDTGGAPAYETLEFSDAWAKDASISMKAAREVYREQLRMSRGRANDDDGDVSMKIPELIDEFRTTAMMMTAVCGRQQSTFSLLLWLLKATRDDLTRFLFAVTAERSLPLTMLVALAAVPIENVREQLARLQARVEANARVANQNDYSSVWRPRFFMCDDDGTSANLMLLEEIGLGGFVEPSQRISIGMHPVSHPFTNDCRHMSITGTCGRLLTLDAGLALQPPHDLHRHLQELFASEQHYGLA